MGPKSKKVTRLLTHLKTVSTDSQPCPQLCSLQSAINAGASTNVRMAAAQEIVAAALGRGELLPLRPAVEVHKYTLDLSYDAEYIKNCIIDINSQLPSASGSKKYTMELKKFLLKQVLLAYQRHVVESLHDHDVKTFGTIVDEVASQFEVGKNSLRQWAAEFLSSESHEILDVDRRSLSTVDRITISRGISLLHVVELNSLLMHRRSQALITSFSMLRKHLLSNERFNVLCQNGELPPCDIATGVIRSALKDIGGFGYGTLKSVGNTGMDDDKVYKRMWRVRVWVYEYVIARKKEIAGLAIICIMDESYIHAGHVNQQGIAPLGEDGKMDLNISRAVGKGERTCFIGGITRAGPVAARRDTGDIFRDCAFIKKGEVSLEKGGKFVELNRNGVARAIYDRTVKLPGLSKMKRNELVEEAQKSDIDILCADGKELTAVQLRLALRAARIIAVEATAACDSSNTVNEGSGKDFSASLAVNTDWNRYREELLDMAPTTFKFMIAKQAKGDYHDNFDTKSFFKWNVALEITYPLWCKQLQLRIDDGEDVGTMGDLYDFEHDRPTRELIVVEDNAPYHHGVGLQLRSKSKAEIVKILQSKNIPAISFNHINDDGEIVLINCELASIRTGSPTKAQLLKGAIDALLRLDPHCMQPPWQRIVDSKSKGEWGPKQHDGSSSGMSVLFAAPYASTMEHIAVEHVWANGKQFVGSAKNQTADRSSAKVIDLLHDRWFGANQLQGNWCLNLCEHAEREMDRWIKMDRQDAEDGGLFQEGGTVAAGDLIINPNIEGDLKAWKKLAGIEEGDEVNCGEDVDGLFTGQQEGEDDANGEDDDDMQGVDIEQHGTV